MLIMFISKLTSEFHPLKIPSFNTELFRNLFIYTGVKRVKLSGPPFSPPTHKTFLKEVKNMHGRDEGEFLVTIFGNKEFLIRYPVLVIDRGPLNDL